MEKAARIISCCCALQKFLIKRGEIIVAFWLQEEVDQKDFNDIADDWFNLQLGIQKRNEIIDFLKNNAMHIEVEQE